MRSDANADVHSWLAPFVIRSQFQPVDITNTISLINVSGFCVQQQSPRFMCSPVVGHRAFLPQPAPRLRAVLLRTALPAGASARFLSACHRS